MEKYPQIGSLWEHYKGGLYRVMMMTNTASTFPERFPVSVVYMNDDTGKVWSRPLQQWSESMKLVSEASGLEELLGDIQVASEQIKEIKKLWGEANRDLGSQRFYPGKKNELEPIDSIRGKKITEIIEYEAQKDESYDSAVFIRADKDGYYAIGPKKDSKK